jgi:Mn2+/Fe2+ NRAMP family transporter
VLDGYARTLHESGRLLGWYQADNRRIAALWLILQALAGMALILFFRSALSPMLTFAMTLAFLTTPVFAWLNFSLLRGQPNQPLPFWLNALSWLGLVYLFGFALLFLAWYLGLFNA